jgi:hypothetical protein
MRLTFIVPVTVSIALVANVYSQGEGQQPVNGLPNPYETVRNWGTLPDGRTWGSTAGVDIDPDGKSIWALDRCGANSCAGSNVSIR